MTDITKCFGSKCKKKKNCYRYTAPENLMHQSWSSFEVNIDESGGCDEYWPNRTEEEEKE